jgi:hypothetical protein
MRGSGRFAEPTTRICQEAKRLGGVYHTLEWMDPLSTPVVTYFQSIAKLLVIAELW